MNKYQEALDRIGRNYYLSQESGDFEHFEILYLENKKTLQELVDRATPKKVETLNYRLLLDSGWKYECPVCKCAIGINTKAEDYTQEEPYCPNCGQALDWSRDDYPHR